MPRRMRVSACGYHHIYNRGVAKNDIFLCDQDKEKFLEILADVSREYKFNIHSFCLMNNHYHILVENKKENLSDGMRQLNAKYANFFNKKYKRVGHLWQDRFKSWFVLGDNYLFTLFKYIEANPIKAHLGDSIGKYKYSATYSILRDAVPFFLRNSFVLRDFNTQELFDALKIPLNKTELENLEKFKKKKFKVKDEEVVEIVKIELSEFFIDIDSKEKRNLAIQEAYENDYTKSQIARELGLSVAGVSKILKKLKV